MFNTRSVLVLVMSLSLIGSTPVVLAGPDDGKGNPHSNQMDDGKAGKGNKGNQGGPGNKGGDAGQKGDDGGSWDLRPRIDVGGVRVILDDNHGYWNPGSVLPPGTQKNLMRDKPLPPGIAKRLDGRLLGWLPHRGGHEQMQAGTDLLLMAVATGLVYEVLDSAFDRVGQDGQRHRRYPLSPVGVADSRAALVRLTSWKSFSYPRSGLQALQDIAQLRGEAVEITAGGFGLFYLSLVIGGDRGDLRGVAGNVLSHSGLFLGDGSDLVVHIADRFDQDGDLVQHGAGTGNLLGTDPTT